ncbi:hypothetical protein BWI17_09440 [Betaproteobacteria bacterium GR16-43]|nr:hypothetical protein BWI17_09440 [Betaproteobacteria bacterium GR16-43]
MNPDNISRTFIGSVVCIDLVGYSTKSVAQQIAVKEAFNRLLAAALKRIPPEDRIILDTGDGAAISFLGDPEESLAVGIALRDTMAAHSVELGASDAAEGAVRIGINLGSVKLAVDLNGYPRIVGDGINVAERIAAFASPGEAVVSHSFYEMVSRLSEANTRLFRAVGKRTDKNGRDHEIYAILDEAAIKAAAKAAAAATAASAALVPASESGLTAFLRDKFKVGFAALLLVGLIAAEAVMFLRPRAPASVPEVAVAPASAPASAPTPTPSVAPPATIATAPPPVVKLPDPKPVALPPVLPPVKVEPPKPEPMKAAPAKAEPVKPEAPKAEASKPARKDESKSGPESRELRGRAPEAGKPARRGEDKGPSTPVYEPPKPPPAEAPREEPKPAVAASTAVIPISRPPPNFPPAAAAKNIDSGSVKARLSIDAAGHVTGVQILEARPRRYFDEEATRSLRAWRFNPGAENRSYDVEIAFQR